MSSLSSGLPLRKRVCRLLHPDLLTLASSTTASVSCGFLHCTSQGRDGFTACPAANRPCNMSRAMCQPATRGKLPLTPRPAVQVLRHSRFCRGSGGNSSLVGLSASLSSFQCLSAVSSNSKETSVGGLKGGCGSKRDCGLSSRRARSCS